MEEQRSELHVLIAAISSSTPLHPRTHAPCAGTLLFPLSIPRPGADCGLESDVAAYLGSYPLQDNETPIMIAKKFDLSITQVMVDNVENCAGLSRKAKLMPATLIVRPAADSETWAGNPHTHTLRGPNPERPTRTHTHPERRTPGTAHTWHAHTHTHTHTLARIVTRTGTLPGTHRSAHLAP